MTDSTLRKCHWCGTEYGWASYGLQYCSEECERRGHIAVYSPLLRRGPTNFVDENMEAARAALRVAEDALNFAQECIKASKRTDAQNIGAHTATCSRALHELSVAAQHARTVGDDVRFIAASASKLRQR
jgi:hypothetical protein